MHGFNHFAVETVKHEGTTKKHNKQGIPYNMAQHYDLDNLKKQEKDYAPMSKDSKEVRS